MHYKHRVLKALLQRRWEQVEIDPDGVGWWAAEHWRLRSTGENYGLEVIISFLVDPGYENPIPKFSGVYEVAATTHVPQTYSHGPYIACLPTQRGSFNSHLDSFLSDLDTWRSWVSPFDDEEPDDDEEPPEP